MPKYSNDVYEFKKLLREFMFLRRLNLMCVTMDDAGVIQIHGAHDACGTLIEDIFMDDDFFSNGPDEEENR